MGKTQNQWLKRTLENSGKKLGQIRNTLYQLAKCRPDSLLLIINDHSGLLLWEGLRQAHQGGVYTLIEDGKAEKIIAAQANNLPVMERPLIIKGNLEMLKKQLQKEPGLKFDCIISRGLREKIVNDHNYLQRLAPCLSPTGKIIAAETLPRFNQRLYRFLTQNSLEERLFKTLKEAEENLYNDSSIDWCEDNELIKIFHHRLFAPVKHIRQKTQSEILISRKDIEHWFTPRDSTRKMSYYSQLEKKLTQEEIKEIKQCFLKQLADKIFSWHTETAYLILKKNPAATK